MNCSMLLQGKVSPSGVGFFIAFNKLPWDKLWHTVWNMIQDPLSDGPLLVALDDFINLSENPVSGFNFFGLLSGGKTGLH